MYIHNYVSIYIYIFIYPYDPICLMVTTKKKTLQMIFITAKSSTNRAVACRLQSLWPTFQPEPAGKIRPFRWAGPLDCRVKKRY